MLVSYFTSSKEYQLTFFPSFVFTERQSRIVLVCNCSKAQERGERIDLSFSILSEYKSATENHGIAIIVIVDFITRYAPGQLAHIDDISDKQ